MSGSDLISDAYRDLNAKLHAADERYGTGAFRWSETVLQLREELGAETVLDYGAGKRTLGIALGSPGWFREYDPAVPEIAELPTEQADMVVCADVLEHIEPDRLDGVLEHIRTLAKKGAFLVISTRESTKSLEDGRNAHLSLHDAAWWKAKLEAQFKVLSWNADPVSSQVVAVVRRLHTLGDIKVISAVSDTIRFEQAARNCGVTQRRLYIEPRHERRAVICGFGPSLRQSAASIAAEQRAGGTVVSVSGAHDFLIANGIVPNIHIECDPREHKCFFTRDPHPKVKYWIASCCHPKLIDNLTRYDLTLWHVLNGDEDHRIVNEIDLDGFLIHGGGSVGVRAVNVMYTQGYRSFSCYGMDCSFAVDGDQHAGEHSGKRQKAILCRCGDTWYKTSGTLIAVAKSFIENMNVLERSARYDNEPRPHDGACIETLVHGDGLLPALIREGSDRVAVEPTDEMLEESAEIKAEAEAA